MGITRGLSHLSPSVLISASHTRHTGCSTCRPPNCELLEGCILLAVVSHLRQDQAQLRVLSKYLWKGEGREVGEAGREGMREGQTPSRTMCPLTHSTGRTQGIGVEG